MASVSQTPKVGLPVAVPVPSVQPVAGGGAAFGLKDKFDQLFGKPRTRVVQCFECDATHEVSSSAHSSTCRTCGAYVDLQDYKITGSFSRNIVTRGSVYLTSKGDLSSSRIICDSAVLYGKMRGNLICSGKVTVKLQGRLPGTLQARHLIIEKGSDIVASRPVKVALAEIHGKMTGQILSEGQVLIYKSGILDGAVTAKGFTVEKGGIFQGELTIGSNAMAAEPSSAGVESARRPTPVVSEPLLGGEQNPVPS